MKKITNDDIIRKIENYATKKCSAYEIYYSETDELKCEITGKDIDFVSTGKTSGFGIRIAEGKKIGLASTNNISQYKEIIDKAIKIAKISPTDKNFESFADSGTYKDIKTFDKKLIDFSPEDFADLNSSMIKSITDIEQNIKNSLGSYTKEYEKTHIINSNGIDEEEVGCINSLHYELLLGDVSLEAGTASNRIISNDKGSEFADRIKALQGKRPLNGTKEMPVILHPECFARFLRECLEPSINAERVIENKSSYADKRETEVFDSRISIKDDATVPMLLSSQKMDDEGTPSKSTDIIKDGVLKNYLQNSYTSKIMSCDNTANAMRNISTKPSIGATNLIMENGSCNDLTQKTGECIIVRDVLGAHTIDFTSGNFSVGISEGFYIKDGSIMHPIRDTMIAGNFYDLMKNNVIEIEKEVTDTETGYYLPGILIDNVKVIGK